MRQRGGGEYRMQARVDNEVGLGHVLLLLKRVNPVKFPQSSNEKEQPC